MRMLATVHSSVRVPLAGKSPTRTTSAGTERTAASLLFFRPLVFAFALALYHPLTLTGLPRSCAFSSPVAVPLPLALPFPRPRAQDAQVIKKDQEKRHKSKKHKKPRLDTPSHSGSRSPSRAAEPVSETESQYDARLERVARRLKEEEERRAKESDGVRFKGRGRMKYLDPELQRDRY